MRYAKYIFALCICLALCGNSVHAVIVDDPPAPIDYSPVFVTALQFTSQLDAIELHNDSPDPIDLSTWSIRYLSTVGGQDCIVHLNDILLPDSYVVAGTVTAFVPSTPNVLRYESCARNPTTDTIQLYDGGTLREAVKPTTSFVAIRKGLTKTYRTGTFSKDFEVPQAPRALYAGEYYKPSPFNYLQITEVVPNARNCSPLETALDCTDYVKVYNPTASDIDLSLYRMRSGYLGQASSASNTFSLAGIVQPGHYAAISAAVTNSGGWLWFEDMYGVKRYDNTVQEYPDASAESKKGHAWAYDLASGIWKWTSAPMPYDAPSVFPVPLPVEEAPKPATALAPCNENQYRSEETNRCRTVATAASTPVPCEEDHYRSPETNRCRAVLGASVALSPCKEGQERNPETNRCRTVLSSAPEPAFAVESFVQAGTAFTGWWILGGMGALAASRGAWEWRSEMLAGIRKLGTFFTSGK